MTEREKTKLKRELEREKTKSLLIRELSHHIGRGRPISMRKIAEIVFQKPVNDAYNEHEGRQVRKIINELRRGTPEVAPMPIASLCCSIAGGYYLATGNELEDFIRRIEQTGLKKLGLAARLRKRTLPELLGQLALEMTGDRERETGA